MLEVILQRRSVRSFTEQRLSREELTLLLRAGMSAPSAVNKQPWDFIVVEDRKMLDELGARLPYAKMLLNAPAAILVCGNLEKTLPGWEQDFWIQDCSAASENILLAATKMHLAGVWTAVYPAEDRIQIVREFFELPHTIIPLNVIALGHSLGKDKPKDKWKPENVHWNKW